MDLTPYITSLREDLTATASAGDEQIRRAAALLSGALEPAARLALMNALADLAAEATAQLPDHVVEVRLDGRDVRVVVTGTAGERERPERPGPPPPPPPPPLVEGGDISRMTLRLVEKLKEQAEHAASSQGVSLNTFISQAVQGALHGSQAFHAEKQAGSQSESHLHGWVKG
ncbi:toxin-antitoxin system HicB family antitoxin [Amycolatopsis thermalba]|uniref:Toxin-antitoxin system HicB family antitoxin n=1 Tax=Amycolatopsis thermalba TaxID=944492 RepID=A0ABY4NVG4_9PSEU|nr:MULTISPECIES: toxin-antitoxin system HicB family antitoxin [Amycolatopsis]OXM71972.1 toxin-antitoxin system HicB family antitoxin [Amycolatopsis sp. KNN50.9b]UQS24064.1 toxin-antitoxin system HicB family antitoxin [Amycolatopsis thermalba]